ncbi:alkaline phosphatase [Xanthomonas campestris]|uniref:alkaline phosphatase n=1 Tax=Xanthomonas campestris TaxID=339 RepID=UPI0008A1638E|nr:alkaline phosphatase [Xanthomonas campestris]MEB1151554.1 alkaline phosphatase [Xanthomonas campestris pv. campestris]MCC5097643.1 alkaline phosphatase [Xanthomonas campestris]MEA9584796.1 alkaline phosphatase [Xanthomonas campestris]MEA9591754.1 alkaline phosphatase [Xanthomonas campestris]MEA9623255.1 alkaline phosphatase [Xanthomonas campestris]
MPMRYRLPALAALTTLCVAACASTAGSTTAAPASVKVDVPPVTHPAGETPQWWYRSGAARAAGNGAMAGKARNVILFLGDGMSLTTVAAARILDGQRKGGPGEENLLSWEQFPATAFSKTYNTDSQTPDSAGTMTAITTGVKSHMGAIGVSSGNRSDCADSLGKGLLSWLQLADSAGMATGVVTTTRLTHATPAATYAHSPERNWENDTDLPEAARTAGCQDIAQQLLSTARFGRGPQVVLGGGRSQFQTVQERDPEYDDKVGLRLDGRDLVAEWKQSHPQGAYVWNQQQLQAAAGAPALLGLFEPDHMQFDHDRNRTPQGEPSLTEMTRTAIQSLSRDPNGFVLMVEGGRIDHANHAGNAYRALDETVSLSDAVRTAVQTAPPDTLIIVTADHSHTLNFVGYPVRGNPILGKVRGTGGEEGDRTQLATDLAGQPYTTLSYANGPGHTGATNAQPAGPKKYPHEPSSSEPAHGRPDLTHVDTEAPSYMQESLVPTKSESHGGEDVGIWATGPGSAAFRGTLEENVIYHVIVQATPRLRERLCKAGTCDSAGVPVNLPAPATFERATQR